VLRLWVTIESGHVRPGSRSGAATVLGAASGTTSGTTATPSPADKYSGSIRRSATSTSTR